MRYRGVSEGPIPQVGILQMLPLSRLFWKRIALLFTFLDCSVILSLG